MEELKYFQDGNSGFIIQSETNDQVAVVWTDTEDDEEINEAEKLTKLFINAPELLEVLKHGLRLANSLPNKESIGVRMFIKNAEKVLEKTLT